MGLLQVSKHFQEGQALNKWIDNRFRRNKNILIAITGGTGSGKSWTSVRICESWYDYRFKREFPVKIRVCFSVGDVMKLLSSGELKKGELVILEEAGTYLNALDFNNKVVKLFTFILQSFRSMNVGLIFTLPVLTMLTKSARLLLHAHFITVGIDYNRDLCKIKPLFHQLNQERGKSYWKYLRVKKAGEVVALERFNYHKPTEKSIELYESKKRNFVYDLSKEFSETLDQIEKEKNKQLARNELTPVEQEVFKDCWEDELLPKESAKKRGRSLQSTYQTIKRIEKKGFSIEKYKNLRKT